MTVEFPCRGAARVGHASTHCLRTHDTNDTTVSRVTIGGRVGGLDEGTLSRVMTHHESTHESYLVVYPPTRPTPTRPMDGWISN